MTIPCFLVIDGTETVLRNLIAYEQQSSDVDPKYFSDYTTFMNHLIDSDKDVNLLFQKGIIENWIGEDKEVATLFNKIGKGVTTYSNFYYKEEIKKAIEIVKNHGTE
uniref:Putative ovule protein n=1 Tax=Solanum chacoense TaxID=4108 RepID=A0A0V0GNA9_SOLCH